MSIFGIFERKVRIVMASPMLTLLVGIGKDRAAFQVESLARVMPLMHIGAHWCTLVHIVPHLTNQY